MCFHAVKFNVISTRVHSDSPKCLKVFLYALETWEVFDQFVAALNSFYPFGYLGGTVWSCQKF